MPLLINHELLPDQVLEHELLRLSSGLEMDAPHAGGADPELLRSRALRNVVKRTLLLQAAAARGVRVSPAEVEAERRCRWGNAEHSVCGTGVTETIAQDMLLARVEAELTRHVPRPGRALVEQHYERNRGQYFQREAVEAAHIFRALTPNEDPAKDERLIAAASDLRRGKPFEQVANRYSDCQGVGGSVGWVERGVTVQPFEDVVFALRPGARSDPFQTVFGWHIATVKRRRNEGFRPLDEVRLLIANQMLLAERQRELNRQVAYMEAGSAIRFVEEARRG